MLLSIGVLAMMAFSLVSCSSNSSRDAGEKFLNNFYHLDFEGAKTLATDDTKKMIDFTKQISTMMPDSARNMAKSTKIEIKGVKEVGDSATITYTVTDPKNKSEGVPDQRLKMIKVDGKWLAQWNKQDGLGADPNGGGAMGDGNNAAPSTTPPADMQPQNFDTVIAK